LRSSRSTRASILVGLLWCLAVLAVVVISVLHTARLDLLVVKNYGDQVQAHYLAVAGIERAKALLYRDVRERSRSALSHSGQLYDTPELFREVPFGRGQFSVLRRARPDEGGGILFGVSDEESRLNANVAGTDELAHLPDITADVVAAIADWRDSGNDPTPGGARADYYLSLRPPCLPRSGPLETVRELLMVRGVTPPLLRGRDVHQNGLLPTTDYDRTLAVDDVTDTGWAGLLTVDSMVDNVSAAGTERVNIQSADETELSSVRGISADIAHAIVAWRQQNRLNSVADLLDVVAPPPQNQQGNPNPNQPQGANQANQLANNPNGPKVISPALLLDIADDLTVQGEKQLAGLVNVNTASLEVLACLPGMDRQLAQAIINFRQSNGFLPNTAWLLQVPGFTPDLFKQLAPRITARSETFRILAEGRVNSSGTRQRIQEIVHVGLNTLTTLSYREDDL
jgi:DNA uptake protein ComE-like DNA-binding protein